MLSSSSSSTSSSSDFCSLTVVNLDKELTLPHETLHNDNLPALLIRGLENAGTSQHVKLMSKQAIPAFRSPYKDH